MFTITICPRCGKDFMFHSSDYHLARPVAVDLETPQICSHETICQECDAKERHIIILKELIETVLRDHPEFQEEHTTGWDLVENARIWLNEIEKGEVK